MEKGYMPLESAKKIIDEANDNHVQTIGLSDSGESLLYPHLQEIVSYIKDKNDKINIFLATNANLPNTPSMINHLAIDYLLISIDGIGETYESIRKKAHYEQFLNNITALSEIRKEKTIQLAFNMVVTKQNYTQLRDVVRLAKQLEISYTQLNPLNINTYNEDWDYSYYDFYLSEDFQQQLQETILIAQQEKVNIGYPLFPDINTPKNITHCSYVWNNMAISWNGYLLFCCSFPFPKIINFGNVLENGLMNCINSKEARSFRKNARKGIAHRYCDRCNTITDKIIAHYQSS